MKFFFRKAVRQALLLLVLAAPAALVSGLLHPKAPAWQEPPLGPGEVRLRAVLAWEEEVVWLDARSRAEYEEAHIPGALLLNEDEWEALFFDFLAVWDPEATIVVYCGGAQCEASQHVAERLRRELGSETIYVLKGGWNEWTRR
jgi:rhodanese-related sulfurtransferase